MLDKRRGWGFLQKISPQSYIIHATPDDHVAWLDPGLLSQLDLYHWPEIFVLQRYPVLQKTRGTYRIKFFCWYCRAFKPKRNHWQMPLEIIEANCSVHEMKCGKALKDIVSVPNSGIQLWTWGAVAPGFHLAPVDSLSRAQVNFTLEHAVAGFLYGINESTTLWANLGRFFPYFYERLPESIGADSHSVTDNVHYVDTTPPVKFFTLY